MHSMVGISGQFLGRCHFEADWQIRHTSCSGVEGCWGNRSTSNTEICLRCYRLGAAGEQF